MKKIFLLFLILIFTNSCGYTPLYKNNNNKNIKFNYEVIDTAGDNEINNYIIKNISKYFDENSKEKIKIHIKSEYNKSGITNNKEGKTTVYELSVNTEFVINKNNKENKIKLEEKIKINRLNDTFEQKNYEIKIKKDLSQLIVNKFIQRMILLNDN